MKSNFRTNNIFKIYQLQFAVQANTHTYNHHYSIQFMQYKLVISVYKIILNNSIVSILTKDIIINSNNIQLNFHFQGELTLFGSILRNKTIGGQLKEPLVYTTEYLLTYLAVQLPYIKTAPVKILLVQFYASIYDRSSSQHKKRPRVQ